MFSEVFEVHWRVGGRAFALVIAPDGTPTLAAAAGVSGGAPASSPPARVRPANRGRPWRPEDDERIRLGHATGEGTEVVAAELGRSRGAVVARLVKLGLVDPAEAGLRYPVLAAAAAVRTGPRQNGASSETENHMSPSTPIASSQPASAG